MPNDCISRLSATVTLLLAATTTSVLAQSSLRNPVVAAVQVAPKSMTGGAKPTLTVALDQPAPMTGSVVSLSWSGFAAVVNAPRSITVPAGQISYALPLTTMPTPNTTEVGVSATLGASRAATTFTVRRPEVVQIGMPASWKGGTAMCVTVQLDGPAPAGGLPLSFTTTSSKLYFPNLSIPYESPSSPGCHSPNSVIGSGPQAASSGGLAVAGGVDRVTYAVAATPVADAITVVTTASVGVPRSVSTLLLPPAVTPSFRAGGCSGNQITSVQGPATVGLLLESTDRLPADQLAVRLAWVNPPPGAPASVTITRVDDGPTGSPSLPPDPSAIPSYSEMSNPTYRSKGCAILSIPATSTKYAVILTAGATGAPRLKATLSNLPAGG